jgi:hypothetical protein
MKSSECYGFGWTEYRAMYSLVDPNSSNNDVNMAYVPPRKVVECVGCGAVSHEVKCEYCGREK